VPLEQVDRLDLRVHQVHPEFKVLKEPMERVVFLLLVAVVHLV
jgi:hypothetical protein